MKNRIICILLASVLVLGLAACRTSGRDEDRDMDDGKKVSFETSDLDGNRVSSADIFGSSDITMVNLWGTYCGPCIREMPDLAELDERLKEKNCAVVGIVLDVEGPNEKRMIKEVKDILDQTGVKYLNLLPWDSILYDFPAEFIPTSFFVDSEGNLVGEPTVGAMGADEYEKLIDEALRAIEK